jgi:hypothetical protein
MSTQDSERGRQDSAQLTPLPSADDLPRSGEGFQETAVREAFDAYRRHVTQLQTQLRVLQAAGRGGAEAEPTGHAVRMDALHLIRAAAEFADALERDAQTAASSQIRKAEMAIGDKQRELQKHETQIEQLGQEDERKRGEIMKDARKEARDLLAKADRDAREQVRAAEASGARLLEQSRHQATELTNSARAEIDQSLEWARNEAAQISNRAREAAEQLLGAAGLGEEAIERVVTAIVGPSGEKSKTTGPGTPTSGPPGGQSAG